jgi:pimeloyl-ACP methyl ester carboxylesterase
MPDRLNQTLVLQDGRRLGFAEYGPAAGRPVLHFHGSGGSRLDRPSDESILFRTDMRFISVDRPGHGLSDFQPGRRLTDWPKDVGQLADHLGIARFYVAGHSAGGPHALACAQRLPERVIASAAISSAAPMNRANAYAGMPVLNRILARASRRLPWITSLIRRMMRSLIMGDVERASRALMSSIPAADKAALYSPQNLEIVVSAVREGFRPGWRGVALDDTLINREWGFDLSGVTPRIDIWHGEDDVNVPIHAAEYLRHVLPHTRATFLPGEGHFFVLKRWESILSALVCQD